MATILEHNKESNVGAQKCAESTRNANTNTLVPSASTNSKRKATTRISDVATKKQQTEAAKIEKSQKQATESIEIEATLTCQQGLQLACRLGLPKLALLSNNTITMSSTTVPTTTQEDQYTCPCGAGCSEYDNDEDICANGCCRSCGGDDFESSGATFAHYTNEEVTSYKIDYVGDGDKDVCTRINCCGYQTHGRNNDCLGLLCSYESSKKGEADKEQLRKHCLGDGEVWAAPYRLFWPTDDGKWEEDSIVAQRLAKQKHPKRFKSRHV